MATLNRTSSLIMTGYYTAPNTLSRDPDPICLETFKMFGWKSCAPNAVSR